MLYYLSLGANLGPREQTIRRAVELIGQQIGSVLRCSDFFYSKPWGFESDNDFCNICCALQTDLQPLEVLFRTQAIERQLGRTEKSKILNSQSAICNLKSAIPHYSDRPIDIDLIRAFDANGEEIILFNLNSIHVFPRYKAKDGKMKSSKIGFKCCLFRFEFK